MPDTIAELLVTEAAIDKLAIKLRVGIVHPFAHPVGQEALEQLTLGLRPPSWPRSHGV